MRRWRRLLFLLSIVICTARCGTLFNQQRSDTATSAQKKFSDVKLTDLLKEERKHNGEILAREIEIAQRQAVATRDATLIAMLADKDTDFPTTVANAIKERMEELQGTDDTVNDLLLEIDEQEEALRVDRNRYLTVRTKTDPAPDCAPDPGDVSPRARNAFELMRGDCAALVVSRADLGTRTNAGLLGSTAQTISAIERARIDAAANVKKAEAAAVAALKAVAGERAKAQAGLVLDKPALDALKKQFDELMLPKAEDLGRIGLNTQLAAALRWAEMRKDAVDQVLGAATSGGPPPEDLAQHLQVAALVPSLAEQWREGFRYPRVSALVMESQRLRIEADRYRRQAARVDEELDLQRAKLWHLRTEWGLLSEASSYLKANNADVAFQKYIEAWSSGRVPLAAAEWKLIGLAHERALDQSETALAQWDGLVRVPLEALVASAGSGLKPAEIARLLQTLEMSALAAGVF